MVKLEACWYPKRATCIPALWPLIPVSWLFTAIVKCRQKMYQWGMLSSRRVEKPVIIVGNLTVGGTGKTPLVIHLATLLMKNHLKPGIISRGYQGSHAVPTLVTKESDPSLVGDEAVLLAQLVACPIVVGRDRFTAATHLLKNCDVDLIISDDGLQHYALKRQVEIAVIDGNRRFGNGYSLPVGPLRELATRLKTVDCVVTNGGAAHSGEYAMRYIPGKLYNPSQNNLQKDLESFRHTQVHAVAGIGNPENFFESLASYEIDIIPHAYPDHYRFKKEDLCFQDPLPVIMTEKDAVKCTPFFDKRHWVLPVKTVLDPTCEHQLLTLIQGLIDGYKTA